MGTPENRTQNNMRRPKITELVANSLYIGIKPGAFTNLQNKICAFRNFFVEISKKMINNICITFQDF